MTRIRKIKEEYVSKVKEIHKQQIPDTKKKQLIMTERSRAIRKLRSIYEGYYSYERAEAGSPQQDALRDIRQVEMSMNQEWINPCYRKVARRTKGGEW